MFLLIYSLALIGFGVTVGVGLVKARPIRESWRARREVRRDVERRERAWLAEHRERHADAYQLPVEVEAVEPEPVRAGLPVEVQAHPAREQVLQFAKQVWSQLRTAAHEERPSRVGRHRPGAQSRPVDSGLDELLGVQS